MRNDDEVMLISEQGKIIRFNMNDIAVKKGNTELLNKINDGLAKIKANGKYAEIYKKWFGKEPPAEVLK